MSAPRPNPAGAVFDGPEPTQKCVRCDTVFRLEDASERVEHMDDMYDRGLVPVIYLVCPDCGSDEIEDSTEEVTW